VPDVVLSVVALLVHAHAPLPGIPDLIESLHAPRKGVVNYEVVVDARRAKGTAWAHLRHIWRDGARERVDHLDRFDDKGAARRQIRCTNGPEVGQYFTAELGPVLDRSRAASVAPLADRLEVGGDQRFRFESLGATAEEVLNQAHQRGLSWYTDQQIWTERRVERARWRGLPAYRIVLAAPGHPARPAFEVTLVPACGCTAVGARIAWESDGKHTVQTTESTVARVAGVWLPKASVYREHTGGVLTAELIQRIEVVSINRPIEARTFTLPGMQLPPGLLVSTQGGLMTWDGSQLVPAR
jgi:hypothetical protein